MNGHLNLKEKAFMIYSQKSRRSGNIVALIKSIANTLEANSTVHLISAKEDDTIIKVKNCLKEEYGLSVKYERLVNSGKTNNIQVLYDEFSETIGIDIKQKEERFIGWLISKI